MHHPSRWIPLLATIIVCVSGCSKPTTGDRTAVSALKQQRVGLVFRASRYVTHNSVHTDLPGLAYVLTANSTEPIANALRDQFQPVILQKFTKKPVTAAELKFDGDSVLVSPNSHAKTIPADDALRSVIASEHLAALMIVDEEWSISDETSLKLANCDVALIITDPAGKVILDSPPPTAGDGAVKLMSFGSGVMYDLSFGQVLSNKDVQDALQNLADQVGKSIAGRIDKFVK